MYGLTVRHEPRRADDLAVRSVLGATRAATSASVAPSSGASARGGRAGPNRQTGSKWQPNSLTSRSSGAVATVAADAMATLVAAVACGDAEPEVG